MAKLATTAQAAAVGLTAMVALELLTGSHDSDDGSWVRQMRHLLAGAAVATAYVAVVPPELWGMRSGASFAQIPLVATAASLSRPQLAIWGACAGLLAHYCVDAA